MAGPRTKDALGKVRIFILSAIVNSKGPLRYPFLLGAMQFAEADTTQTDKIVSAMMKFVTLSNSMLKNNYTGVEEWGAARWQDYVLVLQW